MSDKRCPECGGVSAGWSDGGFCLACLAGQSLPIADQIRQLVKAEQEQCCRDVCSFCENHAKNSSQYGPAQPTESGLWTHEYHVYRERGEGEAWPGFTDDEVHSASCEASAIRERAAKEKE